MARAPLVLSVLLLAAPLAAALPGSVEEAQGTQGAYYWRAGAQGVGPYCTSSEPVMGMVGAPSFASWWRDGSIERFAVHLASLDPECAGLDMAFTWTQVDPYAATVASDCGAQGTVGFWDARRTAFHMTLDIPEACGAARTGVHAFHVYLQPVHAQPLLACAPTVLVVCFGVDEQDSWRPCTDGHARSLSVVAGLYLVQARESCTKPWGGEEATTVTFVLLDVHAGEGRCMLSAWDPLGNVHEVPCPGEVGTQVHRAPWYDLTP